MSIFTIKEQVLEIGRGRMLVGLSEQMKPERTKTKKKKTENDFGPFFIKATTRYECNFLISIMNTIDSIQPVPFSAKKAENKKKNKKKKSNFQCIGSSCFTKLSRGQFDLILL